MSGARDFVARGHADGVDGAICCEPEGGEICHVAKGALRLRIDLDRQDGPRRDAVRGTQPQPRRRPP